jgi:hypothetical protein
MGLFNKYDYFRKFNVGTYVRKTHHFMSRQFRFDLSNCEARSYDWWVFVLRIGDTVYFNNISYSMQTRGHQNMAWNILSCELVGSGLKVKTLYIKEGFQDLNGAHIRMAQEIAVLRTAIARPRSRKKANKRRYENIESLEKRMVEIRKLEPSFTETIYNNSLARAIAEDAYNIELQQRRLDRIPKYKRVADRLIESTLSVGY